MSTQENETSGPGRIRDIITDLFGLLVTNGHRIEPQTADVAMDETHQKLSQICYDCGSQPIDTLAPKPLPDSVPDPLDEPAPPAPAVKNGEQRKYFLLRMVSCKLSHLFDTVNNPRPLSRQCSHGIDAYIRRILKPDVYAEINERAGEILDTLGRGDASILSKIYDNPAHAAFLENLLVRICLSMAKYPKAKDALIGELNMAQENGAPPLGHAEFREITGSLLSDVFLLGRTGTGGGRLDYRYGPNTSLLINAVSEQFSKDI